MSETATKMPWTPFLALGIIWGAIAGILQTVLQRWVTGSISEITWPLVIGNAIIWFLAALAFAAWLRWRAGKRLKAKELEDATPEE
ncbi:MAG: hypothetical protein ABJO09_02725 [Hyphomicrobiales bacterium]